MSNGSQKIIHITDLHFFQFPKNILKLFNKRVLGCLNWELNRKKRFDFSGTERFLNQLEKHKNAVVLISGDLTVTALEEEFLIAKKFVEDIRKKGFPVYVIPGNHDYYTFEAIRKRRYENLFSDYLLSERYPIITALPDGTPLILLHTVRPNFLSARGIIDKDQIHHFGEVVQSLDKPAIVCAHYPVLHHTKEYYSSYSRQLKNARLLCEALRHTKVPLLYIAGHVHHFSLSKDETNSLVTYLCSPPLFYIKARKGGFSEITLENGNFNIKLNSV